jgi:radical SAM protein with 4Fe4S-binding SPASM domain
MKYYLSAESALKWLELPCVYQIKKDELYELDENSFHFMKTCASEQGCFSNDADFISYCLKEGIITRKKVTQKQPPMVKSPVPSLRYLELQITERCNLRCRHCYIGAGASSELSVDQISNILREFESMQGLRVLITGGEPLVHKQFQDINTILPAFPLRKVLFTNGLLLDKKSLKALHIDEFQVSIDGLEKAHDSLRGKGTFRRAFRAIKLALDSGFDVSVATMVHAKNLKDFDTMEKLFRDMGIKDWTVDVPCVTGRLGKNKQFQIKPELGGKFLRYGYGGGMHASSPGFACGLHLMSVMADGRVAKCTFYAATPAGNIEEGLRTCWKRIMPIRLKELHCDCSYLESCRGGCRYRAGLLGDPLGEDLYKCYSYNLR